MASTPVTHPARQIVEHLDALLEGLSHHGPANTREAIWYGARIETLREVRKHLAEQLVDVELEAVTRAMPGVTVDHARFLLGAPDTEPDESLLPLPWADPVAVSA